MLKKKSKKTPREQKRVYYIVPEKVQVKTAREKIARTITMEPGRLMAQCGHAVTVMLEDQYVKKGVKNIFKPITTIVLSVRNSRELANIFRDLQSLNAVDVYLFRDPNKEVYGPGVRVPTAICTAPVLRSVVDEVIGHLEMYGAELPNRLHERGLQRSR